MRRLKMIKLTCCCLVLLLPCATGSQSLVDSILPPPAVFELLALNGDLPTLKKPNYLSPTDLVPSPDGKLLFVAEQTAKRIDVVDVSAATVVKRIRLPDEVTGCVPSSDGTRLYATCSSDRWPAGKVYEVDVLSGRVVGRIGVGFGARAPVITPDDGNLYVCNRYENSVSVVDCALRKETGRIIVSREPYCAAITPDGKTVVVGNLLPDYFSVDSMRAESRVSLIDAATNTVVMEIRLPRGSTSVIGMAVSPDGRYAFATHQIGKFSLLTATVQAGHIHTNNLAVIDLKERTLLNDVCLDLASLGFGDPWGVKCSEDGSLVVVSHAGCSDLSVIDGKAMLDSVKVKVAAGVFMENDMTTIQSVRKRVAAGTPGPRALAMIGNTVYTVGYFIDSLPEVKSFDCSSDTVRQTVSIALDQPQLRTGERQGQVNFYDAGLCYERWHSCHSCHPFERSDGLDWIQGGGATVTPKNSKSMIYAWWTPPTRWTGRAGHTQQDINAGFELELFRIATVDIARPVDTFFMAMKPVPSPFLEKGRLSAAALRGKTLFFNKEKVDCSKCHPGPFFTDNLFWNAGVPDPFDASTQFVTPLLIEAWRTAPYNHIGSMSTLRGMIELPTMSNASEQLSSQEIDDLVAYVESL